MVLLELAWLRMSVARRDYDRLSGSAVSEQFEQASALAGLNVTLGPHGPVDGDGGLKVDVGPGQGAGLLGADPGQQGHDHVGAQRVLAAWFLTARNRARIDNVPGAGTAETRQ